MKKNILKWLGHVLSKEETEDVKLLMEMCIEGKRW